MRTDRSKPWIAPRRYGYGSGLPIAWQGWVVLGLYMLICIGAMPLMLFIISSNPAIGIVTAIGIMFLATVILFVICASKTKGGWRWRWGDEP